MKEQHQTWETVIEQLENHSGINKKWSYHNKKLLKKQIEILSQVAATSQLSKEQMDFIQAGLWLYIYGWMTNPNDPVHQGLSLLNEFSIDKEAKQSLQQLISSIAEENKNQERSFVHQVFYDLVHNSVWLTTNPTKTLDKLHREAIELAQKGTNEDKWYQKKYDEFKNIQFASTILKEIHEPLRLDYEQFFLKKLKQIQKTKDILLAQAVQVDPSELKELQKKINKYENRPERGIETMYRIGSKNLYTRASILDSKSSILLSTNAIVLSVVLGTLYIRISDDPHLIFPIIVIVLTNIISITYSILASRPVIKGGTFVRQDVLDKKVSLLNFDDYHSVSREDYEWAVDEMMKDADYLYHNITWDMYNMGTRMNQKYRNLRIAFNVFLYGLILSLIAFALCHVFFVGLV